MALIAAGWPVVLANMGFGLVQSADRLVVSSALPIEQFAQYGLAASTMFVPMTAIAVVSRVSFTHVGDGRARKSGEDFPSDVQLSAHRLGPIVAVLFCAGSVHETVSAKVHLRRCPWQGSWSSQ
jgi:hypothetical protein